MPAYWNNWRVGARQIPRPEGPVLPGSLPDSQRHRVMRQPRRRAMPSHRPGTGTTATGDNGVRRPFRQVSASNRETFVSEGRGTDKQTVGLKSPIDAASVKIVRQETHFAPSYRLSPIQQVGEGIVASLKAEASRAAAEPQGLSIKPEGEAVKTLGIKLTPIELGTVKVTLKITGGNVEVTMTASNPQTAELLKAGSTIARPDASRHGPQGGLDNNPGCGPMTVLPARRIPDNPSPPGDLSPRRTRTPVTVRSRTSYSRVAARKIKSKAVRPRINPQAMTALGVLKMRKLVISATMAASIF